MKNLKNVWMYLMMMVLSLGMASCSDDDEKPTVSPENLIGTWEVVKVEDGWWQEADENGNWGAKENFDKYDIEDYMGETYTLLEGGKTDDPNTTWELKNGNHLIATEKYGNETYDVINADILEFSADRVVVQNYYEDDDYKESVKLTLNKVKK